MSTSNSKMQVIEKLLKLGFVQKQIDQAMKLHTWIDGVESSINLQILTNAIISSQANEDRPNKKRKLSETGDTNKNSDVFPALKKTKIMNDSEQYYNDMIHLLNDGVISYANSKKQIRTILEQKYNFKPRHLKRNKYFDQALERIVNELEHILEEKPNTNSSAKQQNMIEINTLRDLKAELSVRTDGCTKHGLGTHIYFKTLTDLLEMHCDLCTNTFVESISVPSNLKEEINDSDASAIANDKNNINQRQNKHLNEWDCNEIIYWLNSIENGKLNNIKYDCLKQSIRNGNIKGCELSNVNDTTLKLIGINDVKSRKLILDCLFELVSNSNNCSS